MVCFDAMRTTVRLPDEVLEDAKRYALDHGSTLTAVLEEALREHLARRHEISRESRRVALPTFGGRGVRAGIDLHDTAALTARMEEDDRP